MTPFLTKSQWLRALPTEKSWLTDADHWLKQAILEASLADDQLIRPRKLTSIIRARAHHELRLGGYTSITYLERFSESSTIGNTAYSWALELVDVCLRIGGNTYASNVAGLVLADSDAVWRYTMDFLAEVFTPLQPLINEALHGRDRIQFWLHDVNVYVNPLIAGRAQLVLSHEYVRIVGERTRSKVVLSGGSLDNGGEQLWLQSVSGASLAAILQMVETAMSAYQTLGHDSRWLFAQYLEPPLSKPGASL